MVNFGNYLRFNKKIRYIPDSPVYIYGKCKEGELVKPINIRRYPQNFGLYPTLIIENKYLIRNLKKTENILKKV